MRWLSVTSVALALIAQAFGQPVPLTSIPGQPLSADEVIVQNPRSNVQNVLPMKTIRIYRDSAGRTREDVSVPRDPIANQFVNIEDPVAGVRYSLDIENKIAHRLVYPPPATPGPTPPATTLGPPVKRITLSAKLREVNTKSESLGTQLVEGLATDGQRFTSVSPAPMPGPMQSCDQNVSVVESWYSSELRLILLQKTSNCLGEGTTRLEHINRAEPDPLLFQVPADYTLVDQQWSGKTVK